MNKKSLVSRHVRGLASHIQGIFVEKVWGGRSLSRIFGKELPKGKRIGECWVFYDKKYPVVVKLIDVKKPLSVQVHPKGKSGKSELWYIIEAGEETRVLGGITLKEYKVKRGDWIYIPGGTVHAILPPAILLEISQNNLTTYRLYDWGRGTRKLDIEKGISVLDINSRPRIYRNINSFKCPYFKLKLLKLKEGSILKTENICFVLNGVLKMGEKIFKKGDAFLVENSVYVLTPAVVFLVSWITNNSRIRRSGIG